MANIKIRFRELNTGNWRFGAREKQVKLINNKQAYMLNKASNSNVFWFVTNC